MTSRLRSHRSDDRESLSAAPALETTSAATDLQRPIRRVQAQRRDFLARKPPPAVEHCVGPVIVNPAELDRPTSADGLMTATLYEPGTARSFEDKVATRSR